MKKIIMSLGVVGMTGVMSACVPPQGMSLMAPPQRAMIAKAPTRVIAPRKRVRVNATGYGTMSAFEGYSTGQRRLMAIRASKLEAYRSLAEQIHGVRITGNTTVGSMMAESDHFRAYVDAFIRGAKVVSISPMEDGNYETTVELELDQNFFNALGNPAAGNVSNGMVGGVGDGNAYNASFYPSGDASFYYAQ